MIVTKIFCIINLDKDFACAIKVPKEQFDDLLQNEHITQAPYMAKGMWICIYSAETFYPPQWQQYLNKSYQLVKAKLPKEVKKEIDK